MIDRIDHRLLNRGMGKIPEPLGLRPIGVLDDCLLKVVALNVINRITGNACQRPLKDLLLEAVTACTLGEPDHIDLSSGKEPVRRFIEEQQTDVLRESGFRRAAYDIHLAPKCFHRKMVDVLRQIAAYLAQKILYQAGRKIVQRRRLVVAIIERHRCRQTQQLALILTPGPDGARLLANVVSPFLGLFREADLGPVRPGLAAGHPENQNRFSLHHIGS